MHPNLPVSSSVTQAVQAQNSQIMASTRILRLLIQITGQQLVWPELYLTRMKSMAPSNKPHISATATDPLRIVEETDWQGMYM